MPDYSDSFGGRFYKAADIDKPFTATVASVEKVEMRDGKKKPVMYFTNSDKGVVLNASRYEFMAQRCKSKNTDMWVGAEVTVDKGRTSFGGSMVDTVELRVPERPLKDELDDEIPDFTL
jgi:hypothetical protein